jgi:hypothetical protein
LHQLDADDRTSLRRALRGVEYFARCGRASQENLPGLPSPDILMAGALVVQSLGRRLRQHEVPPDLTWKQKAHEDLTPNHSTFCWVRIFLAVKSICSIVKDAVRNKSEIQMDIPIRLKKERFL